MNITKEQLSPVIDKRFPRLANYLKTSTQSKTSLIILAITHTLHKIYLNTIIDTYTTDYILNYLELNYITKYIKNTDTKTDISTINQLTDLLSSKYITELDLENLHEQELINLLRPYEDISNLKNLKQNILNTYNAIKKEYKDLKII
ncbi:MAG: hypothetical protein ACI4OP_08405 [Candidatus Coprovivens sp.]